MTPGFIPTALGILFSLDVYLAQPIYSKEGIEPSTKQCVSRSLRIGRVRGFVEVMEGGEGVV